jgi:hypothetical protein
MATSAFCLRIGDKERARLDFTCGGALLHQSVRAFDGLEKECWRSAKAREMPVCEMTFRRKHFLVVSQ